MPFSYRGRYCHGTSAEVTRTNSLKLTYSNGRSVGPHLEAICNCSPRYRLNGHGMKREGSKRPVGKFLNQLIVLSAT
jgi:hypothetical protein